MRRFLPVLVVAACACAPATAFAADPTGFYSQLAGHGGCITEDGNSNGAAADCADGRGLSGPSIALTPDGRFLYLYSYAGGITMLSRDTTTGAISQADDSSVCIFHTGALGECADGNGPSTGADSAHAVAVVGGHVYTAGRDDGMVSIFGRSVVTGELSQADCLSFSGNDADGQLGCTTVASLENAQSLAVSPDGKFLYVGGYGTYGLSAFSIGSDGLLTELASGEGCHVAVDAPGCTTSRLAADVYDIALSPDGSTLYGASYDNDAVVAFSRNATSGALTQLSGTGGCIIEAGATQPADPCTEGHGLDGPQSVEVSPDGKLV
jgi:DNA-binding beta-propeller fold protein YncE